MATIKTKQKVLVVLGPTASGKSTLAVKIARRYNGEIISADSRQVYRGLNIGTGKITKREMCGIPHHLLDITNPKQAYSASQFAKAAQKAIAEIAKRNKLPIICGGTGFYIDVALGIVSVPEVPPHKQLRARLAKKTPPQLFAMLKKLDSRRAKSIDPHNPVRLIRAIEIAKALGKVPTGNKQPTRYRVLKIGLVLPDDELRRKIHIRLFARIREGMITEVKRLHRKGLSWKRMEALGLEYRYLARFLQGKMSKVEMLKNLEKETWQYAKRQKQWWKRDKDINWLSPADKKIDELVKEFIKI